MRLGSRYYPVSKYQEQGLAEGIQRAEHRAALTLTACLSQNAPRDGDRQLSGCSDGQLFLSTSSLTAESSRATGLTMGHP